MDKKPEILILMIGKEKTGLTDIDSSSVVKLSDLSKEWEELRDILTPRNRQERRHGRKDG